MYNVTISSGLVDLDKVLFYTAHREKYISKGKGSDFHNAVKSLEEFMSDRTVNRVQTKNHFFFIFVCMYDTCYVFMIVEIPI